MSRYRVYDGDEVKIDGKLGELWAMIFALAWDGENFCVPENKKPILRDCRRLLGMPLPGDE